MAKAKPKARGEYHYIRRQSNRNYLSSLFSIAFILFLLGFFVAIAYIANSFADYAQESIFMKVFLNEGISGEDKVALADRLQAAPYVRDLEYVSKEEAGKILFQKTGEDVLQLLDGKNPFLSSYNVRLKQGYIDPDSLEQIKHTLLEERGVSDIDYPVEMIRVVSKNARAITFFSILSGLLISIIAFYLILGTIRLSVYAQRLSIRTMQLIGATRSFIRRPFIYKGLLQGFMAGIIALLLLLGLMYLLRLRLGSFSFLHDLFIDPIFVAIMAGIVLFGCVLGFVGSFFAVNKYLDKNLDEII